MTDYEKYLGCHFPMQRSENERITHYKISGSCLEGIGVYIPHGGVAFVDTNETPQANVQTMIDEGETEEEILKKIKSATSTWKTRNSMLATLR